MAIIGIFIGLIVLLVGLMVVGVLSVPLLIILICCSGILATIFWIWMLIDAIKNDRIGGNEKIAWVVVIALTHFLGALIYFFAGKVRSSVFGRSQPTV